MIDFIHPRSRANKYGLVLALVSLVVFGFGGFVTVDKVTEYQTAKKIASIDMTTLPSGDYLLNNDLGQQPEDLKELLETVQEYQVSLLPDEQVSNEIKNNNDAQSSVEKIDFPDDKVVVAGIQYDESTGSSNNAVEVPEKEKVVEREVIPNYNKLVIPKMGVNAMINEGETADTLVKGIWRMPQGSTPADGGNTVITAHRYMYRPPDPRTFFLLDKLVPGDTFYIYWEGKRYDYRVRETKIVDPSEISILYNTPNNQVTLFSCTPLFTSKQRLVVIADEL